jgi:hypothetical protein
MAIDTYFFVSEKLYGDVTFLQVTMGRPKKDPSLVRSVPLNFRVSPTLKDLIDALLRLHTAETGDPSLTGWFHALVHREAKRAGLLVAARAKPIRKAASRKPVGGPDRALGARPRVVSARPRSAPTRSVRHG